MGRGSSYSRVGMGRQKVCEMRIGLSPQQDKLYKYMMAAGVNVDVAIVTLHYVLDVKTQKPRRKHSGREMQQQVGSAASRVNKKIRAQGFIITPGDLKHTYRLTTITP